MLGSDKFRNAKRFQKKLQKISPSSPGTKNEFPITLITGDKNCLKKPQNTILNPSKVPHVSNMSLLISSLPKTIPESHRVHQNELNSLLNEVILELQNIFCLVWVGSLPKSKSFLGYLLTFDCKKGYLGKKLWFWILCPR